MGSMNPQLAEMVAGIISNRGSIPNATDAAAMIGKIVLTVATFDVNSVRNVNSEQTDVTRTHVGCPCANDLKRVPTHSESLVDSNAPAMANPPPNSSRIPQGIRDVVSQSIRYFV